MYQIDTGAYWQAQLINWGPRILIAILIIVATWAVARAVKWVLQKAIDRSPALKKHVTGTPEETVGHQLGVIAKLIIWLVGIMAALRFLGIGQILQPINALTLEIFEFLPRLIGAGLIFFLGLIVARIVRRLVETVLIAANVDALLARIGIGDTSGTVRTSPEAVPPGTTPGMTRASLARAAGVLVYALDHHPRGDRRAAGARNRSDLRALRLRCSIRSLLQSRACSQRLCGSASRSSLPAS